jgi:hypothetical protein
MMFVAFFCKIIIEVPKITKMDAFSLFQSETSIFHDEETPFTLFTAGLKRLMKQQSSPKFTMVTNKKRRDKHTHTHRQPKKGATTHSKFKFQIQIAQKRPRGSERCDRDVVRLYLAGKASGWHAGVLLAAPTVKR